MTRRPRFGLCMPTFACPGPALFRAPGWTQIDAGRIVEAAVYAEGLGFDSIWVPDHYVIGADGAVLDGWTTLSVIAGATRAVRLCLIQQSTLFRHAPQFAKMTATLDQLSGGRLTVFTSPGRAEAEHRAYGFPWLDAREDRLSWHVETLDVLRALWTSDGPVSHQGRHFTLREAVGLPHPLQHPHPPLWFAGSEPDLLALAARLGSGWNTPPLSVPDFQHVHTALSAAVTAAGRNISELTVSLETQVLIRPSIAALRTTLLELASRPPRDNPVRPALVDPGSNPFLRGETDLLPPELTERYLIGTPDQIRHRLDQYTAAGVDAFGCWFLDFPDRSSMDLLAGIVGLGA